jgi:hypothetical protein
VIKKVSQKQKRLPVSFTINECVETDDSRFLAITIDVLHTGLNFNGSIFDKEVVDACAESIKNTPVLGYIALNPDGELDFQGHKYKLIEDENGKRYVYAGSAYGVIPESCNYRWIEKVCSDGICREFFQVDALLWTKFDDAVTIFERDGGKPQSMELELSSITGEEQEDGTFKFTEFKFDGCCLLSSTDEKIQPAMIDSEAVAQYTVSNIAQEIKEKLQEYSLFTAAGKELTGKEDDNMAKDVAPNFTLNLMEQLDEIHAILDEKTFRDKWGWECSQFCFVDVQDDEVIVMDRADHYRMYGMKFSMENDEIKIDFDSAVRKKTKYENIEGAGSENEIDVFEKAFDGLADYMNNQVEAVTKEKETAEQNYTTVKNDYDEMKPKYDAYVADEQKRQADAAEAAKDAEFAKFDQHLGDNADYINMKENRNDFTVEQIQNQCAILFTEKNLNANFSRKDKNPAPMVADVFEQKPAVEVNSRYGILPTKK